VVIILLFCFRPGYTKIVPTEGMPVSTCPTEKGDLIIKFDIEFPHTLTPERKDLIRTALFF
jgi:DnaJ family protein B protein 13